VLDHQIASSDERLGYVDRLTARQHYADVGDAVRLKFHVD
jgi:hypothetical protein